MEFDQESQIVKPPKLKWAKGLLYACIMSIVISMPLLIHQLPEIINAASDYECTADIKINEPVQSYNNQTKRIA